MVGRASPFSAVTRADQARDHILRLIQGGEVGDRLPGESELASRLGVSRVTIRDALRQIWLEGIVVRKWGAGTYIASPPAAPNPAAYRSIFVDVGAVGSLPDRIRATGLDVKVADFAAMPAEPPEWVAQAMESREELWQVERTLHIAGAPGVRFVDYLPRNIGSSPVDPTVLRRPEGSIPDVLARHGVRAVKDEAQLNAVRAPADVAASLDLSPGDPVLRARQQTQGADGRIVECAEVHYNGDVFATILVRSIGETR